MSKKETLLQKISQTPSPKNVTMRELDQLMRLCGCEKSEAGRGSGVRYRHQRTGRILVFDQPHPGHELYRYQVKKVLAFLKDIGEF